jgi:alpha-tubulin suppressor-like RCC1 family protein
LYSGIKGEEAAMAGEHNESIQRESRRTKTIGIVAAIIMIPLLFLEGFVFINDLTKRPVYIFTGSNSSYYIDGLGRLWAWGYNEYGQLGDGTTQNRTKPIKVMDNVASVSSGYSRTAVIKKDGSLWLWGYNEYGQLGDGTTNDSMQPIMVMDEVKAVSAHVYYTMAVKTDGSLWVWGWDGHYRKIGEEEKTIITQPTKMMDNVKSVSAGGSHVLALKEDGTLWTWGNYEFALKDSAAAYQNQPVQVMENVTAISTGIFIPWP